MLYYCIFSPFFTCNDFTQTKLCLRDHIWDLSYFCPLTPRAKGAWGAKIKWGRIYPCIQYIQKKVISLISNIFSTKPGYSWTNFFFVLIIFLIFLAKLCVKKCRIRCIFRVEILDIVILMYWHQRKKREKKPCLKAIAIPPCLDGDRNFWHFYRKFEVFSIIQIVLLQDKNINPWGQY